MGARTASSSAVHAPACPVGDAVQAPLHRDDTRLATIQLALHRLSVLQLPEADTRCYGYLLSCDDVADVALRGHKTLFGAELSTDDIKYIKLVRFPA